MRKLLKLPKPSLPKFDRATLGRLLQNPRSRSFVIVFSFAIVGAALFIATKAATPTTAFEAETGVWSGGAVRRLSSTNGASNGAYIQFGTGVSGNGSIVQRFFAPDATWNRPVSEFGESTTLQHYADRFWTYGGVPAAPGTTNVHFKDYSVPIYDIKEATKTVRLFQVMWSQNQQSFSTSGGQIGDSIPWNDNWKPGTGNDRIMHIVNYDTGYNYGMWVVGEPKAACNDRNIFGIAAFDGPNTKAGYQEGNPDHLCIAAYGGYGGLYTTKDGSTHNDRGMGIDKLALVTRADEVKSGTIRHALELTITSTMFGAPECSPNKGFSATGAGTSCGVYVAPATRVEFASNENDRITNRCGVPTSVTTAGRSQTTPEGMRFAIKITDAEIETWLNSRGFTGAKRETARIFAVAFRDYGAIVAETGCYGIGIETDGLVNPASAATWASLGITDVAGENNPQGDLLQGLLTRQRLYVVNPPN